MDNKLLSITEEEFQALAIQDPDLARRLVPSVLRLRAAADGSATETAALPWADSWAPLLTLLDAFKPRPATEYLVDPLIVVPSVTMMYGPAGVLKSMLLMDLVVCVALGLPWLPPAPGSSRKAFAVQQAAVLWVDLDQGEGIMAQRLAALTRGHGGKPEQGSFIWKSLPKEGFNLLDKAHVGDMALRMRACQARLLCIDNLGVSKGAAEENTDQMIPVMAALRYLSEELGAAVILLHHARKENGFKSRYSDAARGHSSIAAGLDLGLSVERDGQSPLITLRPGKVRRASLGEFSAAYNFEHITGMQDLWSAHFERVEGGEGGGASGEATSLKDVITQKHFNQIVDEAILTVLQGQHLNQKLVARQVQKSQPAAGYKKICERLEILVKNQRVTVQRGLRNTLIFSLQEQLDEFNFDRLSG